MSGSGSCIKIGVQDIEEDRSGWHRLQTARQVDYGHLGYLFKAQGAFIPIFLDKFLQSCVDNFLLLGFRNRNFFHLFIQLIIFAFLHFEIRYDALAFVHPDIFL